MSGVGIFGSADPLILYTSNSFSIGHIEVHYTGLKKKTSTST